MGTRNRTYGESCASARNVARYGAAFERIRNKLGNTPMVEELFLAALHEMTAKSLRDIADAIDPALPVQ